MGPMTRPLDSADPPLRRQQLYLPDTNILLTRSLCEGGVGELSDFMPVDGSGRLIRRIKATGTIPTPFYTYVYYHGDKWAEYGEEKMRWMFCHRSFLDAGIWVAAASDYMPGPYEPMMALQSLVTRRDFRGREWGPNQKITVDEALRVCTLNAAYASKEEHSKGSIVAGKLADFTMLAADPHDVDPSALKDIKIVRTVVGGRTMYAA